MDIKALELKLSVERAKSLIYKDIIQSNLNIKVKETDEKENIENIIRALIDDFNLISDTHFQLVETNCEFIIEDDDKDEKTAIQEQLKAFYNDIQETRAHKKLFHSFKSFKIDLFLKINLSEYIQIIKAQVEILTKMFQEKKYTEKKINESLIASLSILDLRLLRYNNDDKVNLDFGNDNGVLEIDQIQHLTKCVEKSFLSFASYEVFDKFVICKQFFNYAFVVNSATYLMEVFVKNTKNIIYVDSKRNKEDDHFSFYTLHKLVDNKKHWIMDCRLEDLTNHLMVNLLPYLIKTFRKIYYDVFHDNLYRKKYATENAILEFDGEQLVQNICLLANFFEFSNLLKDLVRKHNSYKKTTNDWFNIVTDDVLQKKAFLKKKNDLEHLETLKLLFDDISNEDCVDFYKQKFT